MQFRNNMLIDFEIMRGSTNSFSCDHDKSELPYSLTRKAYVE